MNDLLVRTLAAMMLLVSTPYSKRLVTLARAAFWSCNACLGMKMSSISSGLSKCGPVGLIEIECGRMSIGDGESGVNVGFVDGLSSTRVGPVDS